jgi:hypothetical protein
MKGCWIESPDVRISGVEPEDFMTVWNKYYLLKYYTELYRILFGCENVRISFYWYFEKYEKFWVFTEFQD